MSVRGGRGSARTMLLLLVIGSGPQWQWHVEQPGEASRWNLASAALEGVIDLRRPEESLGLDSRGAYEEGSVKRDSIGRL